MAIDIIFHIECTAKLLAFIGERVKRSVNDTLVARGHGSQWCRMEKQDTRQPIDLWNHSLYNIGQLLPTGSTRDAKKREKRQRLHHLVR